MDAYLIIFSVIVLLVILIVAIFVLFKKNPSLAGEAYQSLIKDMSETSRLTNDELRLLRTDINTMKVEHDKETRRLKEEIRELRHRIERDMRVIIRLEARLSRLDPNFLGYKKKVELIDSKTRIKKKVQNGHIEGALSDLNKIAREDKRIHVMQILTRYNRLLVDKREGSISQVDYTTELNQITRAILDIVE